VGATTLRQAGPPVRNRYTLEFARGVLAMPIDSFLDGKTFDPELIAEMSSALERVCEVLKLNLVDDRRTRLVAQTIIHFAKRGIRDADTLRLMTLREFKAD
jgi:hypothetical protein